MAIVLIAATIVSFAFWALIHGSRRAKSGLVNNWQNEDYMAREADGTWAEGSIYPKTEPRDSTGLGL